MKKRREVGINDVKKTILMDYAVKLLFLEYSINENVVSAICCDFFSDDLVLWIKL